MSNITDFTGIALNLAESVETATTCGFEIQDEYGNMHWAVSAKQIANLRECATLAKREVSILAEAKR